MTPEAGRTYRDRKPSIADPNWRRLVEVTDVDHTYVHGVGRWQEQDDGVWRDAGGIAPLRKTRILRVLFVKQYEPVEVDA